MSERYGRCSPCAGSECFMCGGTRFSGDANLYLESQLKYEWERDTFRFQHGVYGNLRLSQRAIKLDDEFYRDTQTTDAMEKTVNAFLNAIREEEKHAVSK